MAISKLPMHDGTLVRNPSLITRRQVLIGAGRIGAGAVAASLLAACSGPRSSPAQNGKINVQLDWLKTVQFGGYFYAFDAGLYEEVGLQPSFQAKGGDTDPINVVTAGAADIGVTSGQDAVVARSRNIPIIVFGALFQESPGALVSLKEKGIASPQDLIGKRIGIQGTARTSILSLLESANISKDDVQLVPVGTDPSVLIRDQADALTSFATNQPIFLIQEGFEVNVIPYSALGRKEYAGVLMAPEETYNENRDVLISFIKASQEGWSYTVNHTEAVAALMVNKYGESLELGVQELELEAIVPLVTSPLTEQEGLLAMDMAVWEATQTGLLDAGQIDDSIDVSSLVKLDVAGEASS